MQDLLAIARALYVHSNKLGAPDAQQTLQLRGIGAQLTLGLQRAREGAPGTFKHRAAWLIAEQALADLVPIMGELRGSVLLDVLGVPPGCTELHSSEGIEACDGDDYTYEDGYWSLRRHCPDYGFVTCRDGVCA